MFAIVKTVIDIQIREKAFASQLTTLAQHKNRTDE